ncbi:chemotaxis protein MotB [Xinfangfangia sp. D13-10-4-6]|uniref:flagellar motor protein MotB n=1 Tax=Pseudogemmobacter hezensis TaxID=2737662 RepID=UPI0015556037|nr:flagellar motor protein MotB [Pseudogemmobacter hezensis]NPD17358.1 chemotaxis protein MotB [Pseudogemmobacter hezensis]
MAGQSNAPPVIIKRKKKVSGGGHHGGAWKVAYADFVTAMMAFFLLMWLLNATTEKQRKGLSDYFSPTIPLSPVSGGGDGALNGETLFSQEMRTSDGTGGSVGQDEVRAQQEELEQNIEDALLARGGESHTMEQLLRHVVTRVTDEGLVIELFDLEEATLFRGRSAEPQQGTIMLAEMLAEVLNLTANDVAVNAYVQSFPVTLRENPAWGLTAERARVMRLLLQDSGMRSVRFKRIGGFADRSPAVADPAARRNNRVEIILLRRDR